MPISISAAISFFHAGPTVIFLIPSPTITAIEGEDIELACGPLDPLPPILEINGVEADPANDTRLSFVDFIDNRTYTYFAVQRDEDGSTFQCFSGDRSLSSNVTTLIVYCK